MVTTALVKYRDRWAVEDPVLDTAILICDMMFYRAFMVPEEEVISDQFSKCDVCSEAMGVHVTHEQPMCLPGQSKYAVNKVYGSLSNVNFVQLEPQPCPDCGRKYGHLNGCRIVALHKALDGAIAKHGVDKVKAQLLL